MRALICTPGTTLVIGVLLRASGAITPRSVCGVNANAGSVAIELFAGVVFGLLVVRSVLSTHDASTSRSPSFSRIRSQRIFCAADEENEKRTASAAAPFAIWLSIWIPRGWKKVTVCGGPPRPFAATYSARAGAESKPAHFL